MELGGGAGESVASYRLHADCRGSGRTCECWIWPDGHQRFGGYRTRRPGVGDIVVFHPPRGADSFSPVCGVAREDLGWPRVCGAPTRRESKVTLVERVVGSPGDRIAIRSGHVIRNGAREKDRYIARCGSDNSCRFPTPVVIPPGDYFMMGDNRPFSDDSRFWGPVHQRWILGKVVRR
ncbi:MAG: signal peptidase I [Solirubrobacteraceae bacterium]